MGVFQVFRIGMAVLGVFFWGDEARACGGFFCRNAPMDQVGERILFAADGQSVITHVQIEYTGSAEDFAWVLPVPSPPDLRVSHNEVFAQLQAATRPAFVLDWEESACGFLWPPFDRVVFTTASGGEPDVEVVSQQRVGPYETSVITADDPEAITRWLVENGYRLDALGAELLRPYVESGFYFLALKLAPDREIGDLQPIAMTYTAGRPGIPIRLTAVATRPNLGVLAWVLGAHRAIPENYLHVQINEARLDWLGGGANYDEVVTEAADAADGQAFVTDYAGPSSILDERIYRADQFDLDRLRNTPDPADFLEDLLRQGFPRDAQMQTLIRRHIAMPEAVLTQGVLEVVFRGDEAAYQRAVEEGRLRDLAEQSYYNNLRAYAAYTGNLAFDPEAFTADLDQVVVQPLQAAQNLFGDFPYLTRLYTTLSAEEMTVDPTFSFNPDLPEVSNIRRASARFECPEGEQARPEDAVLVVTLSDGREIRSRPFADAGSDGFRPPAARLIEKLDTAGPPVRLRQLSTVAGDFDGDGRVGFGDLVLFARAFGKPSAGFDLTGDGTVGFEDFLVFVRAFGSSAQMVDVQAEG